MKAVSLFLFALSFLAAPTSFANTATRIDLCNLIAYNQRSSDVVADAEEMKLEFFKTDSNELTTQPQFPHPLSLKGQLKEALNSQETLFLEVTYYRDHQNVESFVASINIKRKNKNFLTSFKSDHLPKDWSLSFSAFGNDYHLNCYISQLH